MTIDELLETARAFCQLAERETNRDAGKLERAAQYAAIAQAFATTAQTMILAGATARIGGDKVRVFRVDTGD
jgi:hypothetical protein